MTHDSCIILAPVSSLVQLASELNAFAYSSSCRYKITPVNGGKESSSRCMFS